MKKRRFQAQHKTSLIKSTISLFLFIVLLLSLSACSTQLHSEQASQEAPTTSIFAAVSDASRTTDAGFSDPESTSTQTQPETEPWSDSPSETEPEPDYTSETETESAADESWKLLLVNADHPLPSDFTVTLKELRNDHHVDERIYPELQQMFDDARRVGIYPFINESYRTAERQQEILDKFIANYEDSGMPHEQAVEKALTVVAVPGTSEHQLGLALDIIAEYDADSTATWQWLKENCWRYGFILRYPANKEAITGIAYEPWHVRYVGTDAAKKITEGGICLEEYLLKEPAE